jgi:hypothetical protein
MYESGLLLFDNMDGERTIRIETRAHILRAERLSSLSTSRRRQAYMYNTWTDREACNRCDEPESLRVLLGETQRRRISYIHRSARYILYLTLHASQRAIRGPQLYKDSTWSPPSFLLGTYDVWAHTSFLYPTHLFLNPGYNNHGLLACLLVPSTLSRL